MTTRIGRAPRGAPLSPESVAEIKALLIEGEMTQRTIADLFSVTPGTISHIRTKRVWRDVAPARGNDEDIPAPQSRGPGLTHAQVRVIRELLAEGRYVQADIAKMFDVTTGMISHIKTGIRFGDVH